MFWLSLLAVALLAWEYLTSEQTPPSQNHPIAVRPSASDPATLPLEEPPAGRRMLRVDVGTRFLNKPRESASQVYQLPAGGLLQIEEQNGSWYRLRLGAEAAVTDGWALIADGASREVRLKTVWQVPRPSRPASDERLVLARHHLGADLQQSTCGSYPLITDVRDAALLAACDRLASSLDATFEARYGVRPLGQGSETLVLFRQLDDFQGFVRAEGLSTAGYAGHASATGGYLVMYSGAQDLDEIAVTLSHEMAHLVSWRALGGPLPRWLSEGLADGIGDSATPTGFEPVRGLLGVEAEAQRLRSVRFAERPSCEALIKLQAEDFDAAPQDRHYEHSALLVRFLLLDDEFSSGFREFLGHLGNGQAYDSDRLRRFLKVDWETLDRRFWDWLDNS